MEFEYTGSVYIQENDLAEMCSLCKNKGYLPREAYNEVSMSWDDCDYYVSEIIADDVIKEIERRLEKE